MSDIVGRIAFITGGASGIGLALGKALADAGAKVILADIDEAALAAAERDLDGEVATFQLDRVLVLGAGSIALGAIYWARWLGAGRIVALSRSARRADMALRMGADAFLTYGEDEVAEAAEAMGGTADAVFECVGLPGLLGKAIDHVGLMGQVVSLGFGGAPDPLVPAVAGMRVRMQFPVGYSHQDFGYVAQAMTSGHADPKALISSVVSLEDLPAKFEELLGPNTETKVQVAPG